MSKRVCVYARVSKSSQSVERQLAELSVVADRNNWEIVDKYTDHGISGSKGREGRPELDRIMKDNTKPLFFHIKILISDSLRSAILIEGTSAANSDRFGAATRIPC